MASLQDDGNAINNKGKNKTTLGFIATAFMLVTASLFAVIGTASNFVNAQLPDGTQEPSTNNTTTASQDNQDLTTVDPMEKAREASSAVIGALIFYERALNATGIEPARITDPNVVIPDVTISEIPLGRVQEVLEQYDANRTAATNPQETLQGNTTTTFGTGSNIVSPADYLVARALAAKAIESFSEASASEEVRADPAALERLAETQQNLSTLLGIIDGRAPYNIAEDQVATINSNIEQIFGVTAGEIR